MEDKIAISSRTYLSMQHIQSAYFFARAIARSERSYNGTYDSDLISEHRAYVTAAIFFAVAFLEGNINEFFLDAHEGLPGPNNELQQMPAMAIQAIGARWDDQFAWKRVLDKYTEALALAGCSALPTGGGTAPENVKLLIDLRNALVHYKPETVTGFSQIPETPFTVHDFEKKLRQKKFSLNPLTGQMNPFYPDKCLSHGCARWAVSSSLRFADQFFAHLRIPAFYEHLRPLLVAD